MSQSFSSRSRRALALAPLVAAALAVPAGAAPIVYHSELADGTDETPGEPGILGSSTNEPVYVYVKRGAQLLSAGTVCDTSNVPPGDEICGADVTLEVQGSGHITGFSGSGVIAHPTTFTGTSRQIRVTIVRAVPPPADASEVFLGTLEVDTTGTQRTDVVVKSGQIVNAAKKLESIAEETIATTFVPEPGLALQLAAGFLALAGLRRLSGRRAPGAP